MSKLKENSIIKAKHLCAILAIILTQVCIVQMASDNLELAFKYTIISLVFSIVYVIFDFILEKNEKR